MDRFNENFAINTAVELAKINIQSSGEWHTAAEVNDFIKTVYEFLTETKTEK